jgi:hypothetical protein
VVRLAPLLPCDPGRGGRWADHRRTINGILFRTRTVAVTKWLTTSEMSAGITSHQPEPPQVSILLILIMAQID